MNCFHIYFENFLHITINLVNSQVMPTRKYSHVTVLTHGFQKLEKVKKGRTETNIKMVKCFFDVILDGEIFTYLKK